MTEALVIFLENLEINERGTYLKGNFHWQFRFCFLLNIFHSEGRGKNKLFSAGGKKKKAEVSLFPTFFPFFPPLLCQCQEKHVPLAKGGADAIQNPAWKGTVT